VRAQVAFSWYCRLRSLTDRTSIQGGRPMFLGRSLKAIVHRSSHLSTTGPRPWSSASRRQSAARACRTPCSTCGSGWSDQWAGPDDQSGQVYRSRCIDPFAAMINRVEPM
jgi:hypothetical protein